MFDIELKLTSFHSASNSSLNTSDIASGNIPHIKGEEAATIEAGSGEVVVKDAFSISEAKLQTVTGQLADRGFQRM